MKRKNSILPSIVTCTCFDPGRMALVPYIDLSSMMLLDSAADFRQASDCDVTAPSSLDHHRPYTTHTQSYSETDCDTQIWKKFH